ncbi:hypothetical protein ACF0H5_018720 [Mactra antiquata]
MRRLLLISNSTLHGSGYLDHCKKQIKEFLSDKVKTVLFVPYALHDRDDYTSTARKAYNEIGYQLEGIHEKPSAVEAVRQAEALFIGGGNTFRLLKTLYDENIVDEIYKRVYNDGMPYIGSSAGTNVATVSINTTNDMPIVFPPSFKAINLVPFNINAHYQDPDPNSKHMGETRAKRIEQYHEYEDSPPVLGIREGCILHVEGDKATLRGVTDARLFVRGKEPVEYKPDADMSFLL